MLLNPKVQNTIKRVFTNFFASQYSFDSMPAPQGQNQYSSNFILKGPNDDKFLLKVLLLKKIPKAVRGQVNVEINVYKNVISPYVVKLIAHAERNKFVFLIFPYLEGENLEEFISRNQNVNEARAKEIGIGILRGVADINRRSNGRIVHQDLKPQNILITSSGGIVLLDFGAARYKQSIFRGRARYNFAYSSREQIRASRPYSAEELRLIISDKSDVFTTGLILYRLLEGKHPHQGIRGKLPADAILEAIPIKPLSDASISQGLKRIINKMLEYEPLNRLNAIDALSALENGDIQTPTPEKSKLFYCAASSTNAFSRFKNKNNKLFDGLVVEATQLPSDKQEVADMHNMIKTVIIDPQTYLFQYPDLMGRRAKEKFNNFGFYRGPEFWQNTNELIKKIQAKDQDIKRFIEEVFLFQMQNGADVLIAPYFYISEFNDDYWTLDQETAEIAIEVYEGLKQVKPLIKGIAISEEILQSDTTRSRLIEYLQALYDYQGYFVLLQSSQKDPITNTSWLKSAREFFTYLLATNKFVIWSRADIFGLLLAISGLNITVGELAKQRKFYIEQPPGFGKKSFFFYLPRMFAKIKWPDGLRALQSYIRKNQLICSDVCCSGVDFNQLVRRERDDLFFHYMTVIKTQFDTYVSRNGTKSLEQDIDNAIVHFNEIRSHSDSIVNKSLKDIKPDSNGFLINWKNVLGI